MSQLPDRDDELARFVQALPSAKAAELSAKIERDRLRSDNDAPAIKVLGALRPLLRASKPPRWPTPKRLFCVPFEDLLIDGPRQKKQLGRIMRSSVEPVWRWLSQDAVAGQWKELTQAVIDATLARDETAKKRATAAMQRAGAGALEEALNAHLGPPERHPLLRAFGNADTLEDAREMALMLAVAPKILPLQLLLPRPIAHLTEGHLNAIRTVFDDLTEHHPAQAPYLALAVMGRLEQPWEALGLARVVSRQTQDTLISATDLGIVGEVLLTDLEEAAGALASIRQDRFDADMALLKLERFTQIFAGMTRELGIRRDGRWGARLMKARASLAEAVTVLLTRAPAEIAQALPLHRMGAYAKGMRKPDLSREPNPLKGAAALQWAAFLARAQRFASSGAYQAAHSSAYEEAAPPLRHYAEALLSELRTADRDARARVEAHLAFVERLCSELLGDEEAGRLRRRIVAATAA